MGEVAALMAAPSGVGSVVAGYLVTAAGLAGYVTLLIARSRRARRTSAAVAARARDHDRR